MKVSTTEPFQIIYSLLEHEYLGYLFESFVVQLDSHGKLTFKHQNISSKNAKEFADGLDEADFQLIKLMDAIQQDAIVKKFYNKKISPGEFFLKVYDKTKGDTLLQEAIASYIEVKKAEILQLLVGKMVFEMGSDGEPAWKQVEVLSKKATVLFHFMRNEENTHYFPTIRYEGEKVEFQHRNAIIVCNSPAWLLVGTRVYSFEKDVDGNKLKPFLNKRFIVIPKSVEDTYYQKFVTQIVGSFDVHAKGFVINNEAYEPTPLLTFSEMATSRKAVSLFDGDSGEEEEDLVDDNAKIIFNLNFRYGNFSFNSDVTSPAYVKMEKTNNSYVFHKVKRSVKWEVETINKVKEFGLDLKNGKATMEKGRAFSWINAYKDRLTELGFEIRQNLKDSKKYFLGTSSISMEVKEKNDWFDIYAIVKFGDYEIPFIKLKNLLLKKQREFQLPNGEIAVIPEEWFSRYTELFAFIEHNDDGMTLKKHHLALVHELKAGNLATVTISEKLEKLRDFDSIEDCPMPEKFNGELRPYQKAGYNWLRFLKRYNFGGCLADDMGLGKTIQTLAMLQAEKEEGALNATLLIMPTSLIYNWEEEAKKFTPNLKVFNYTGTYRAKNVEQFEGYDVVLTSYGTVRMDIEILKQYYFHYIILDESQVIKNPESHIAQSVKELKCKHKLILSGTPIENSTMDLWSQMSFVNPGLLGGQTFFRNEFLNPIEKRQDETKVKKLYSLIKPFILRRQKSQVATELPQKIEQIKYCKMTEEQEKEYEKVKSHYRNMILESIEEKGVSGSQILLLQGLTKLRQLANHPRMTIEDYEGDSGKMEDMTHMLENALGESHKVLIFSQFVKHLALVKEYLEKKGIVFTYLDGSTKNRQVEVEKFQKNEEIRVFLISLKAGGLGLNLTAADYVFLLDPWWNPAIENQAVDRAYRIGQKNRVFTYKFITKNTVEEKILNLQKNKLKLANDLITTEESFVKNLTKDDIQSIFD